jgi:predicted ATP-binding protein involved in virulence
MKPDLKLERFEIERLWGTSSYNIPIEKNILLLVAENGAGKTTVLLLLFYFLSKQWGRLMDFDFESITATINEKKYTLRKKEILVDLSESKLLELQNKYVSYKEFIAANFQSLVMEYSIS